MPGSITLPQAVLELEEEDRQRYEALKPPATIVVRYGYMRMVAELPYDGQAKPGCGSKLVIRTRRGTELGEMLTTTCGNAGCGKSVSRKQMLEYIANSGGKDYPFSTDGRVLRVATAEDLHEQARLDSHKPAMVRFTKAAMAELALPMKLVDVELLLGGERVIFHYTSEQWVDFRELVRRLAGEFQTRIEMHQVNARDEARLVADYEKCGQHCCCKQFLKVLKPVSMRSAKVQKATLDPTKISGRCGRLMCCLRYEDETYESLRKRLPKRNTRVLTPDGVGSVLDSQILTQLVLVRLDAQPAPAAYPLESLEVLTRDDPRAAEPRPAGPASAGPRRERGGPPRPRPGAPLRDADAESREGSVPIDPGAVPDEADEGMDDAGDAATPAAGAGEGDAGGATSPPGNAGTAPRGRRRRRRRGRGGGGAGGDRQGGPPPVPPGPAAP